MFVQSTDEGCQRQQVVVRKRDSFNSKARPVSTASVDGKNTGIKAQGSVKKKDARPPSIAESDDSVVLSEVNIDIVFDDINSTISCNYCLCRLPEVTPMTVHGLTEGNRHQPQNLFNQKAARKIVHQKVLFLPTVMTLVFQLLQCLLPAQTSVT